MLFGKSIAVVVPAYNEERLIGAVLAGMPGFVDHLIVVDDASTDGTAAIARRFGHVHLIAHPANRGVGAAIASGFEHALRVGAEITAVMAGDGQMDPIDLPSLLRPLVLGEVDCAKGNRLDWPSAKRLMPWHRWAGNHLLSVLTSIALGLRIRDSQCGYAALNRRAKQALDWNRLWRSYGYPNDLLSRLAVQGLEVRDVPVRPVYGEAKSGIRFHHVIGIVFFVLVRAWIRRLRASRAEVALTPWTQPR
jgi:glycosyltransferase involved in cell wall biosynthesis